MGNYWFDILWAVALQPLMFWLAASILKDMPDEAEGEPSHALFFSNPKNRPVIKKYGPKAFRFAAILCIPIGIASLFSPIRAMVTSAAGALIVLLGCMIWLVMLVRKENKES